ncbi:MAG: hypothetical protein GXP24_13960, partial [Planctomycetes bacterium]|nr:hypothetical protein [Planctomycetota bacterium]
AQKSNPRESHHHGVSRRYAPLEAIHRHSSTAYEGARRGEAAFITAVGEYLNDEAQAALVWQHVESLHYDNEIQKTATALTRKKMLNDFHDYERQRRFERKEQSKQLWQEKYQELARAYRLNEYQLNWETGAIYWPALVASPRYAKHRERLDVLLDRVVSYGKSNEVLTSDEIAKVCQQFRNQLKEDFAQDRPITRQDYSEMQRFLLGLKYAPVLIHSGETLPTLAMR